VIMTLDDGRQGEKRGIGGQIAPRENSHPSSAHAWFEREGLDFPNAADDLVAGLNELGPYLWATDRTATSKDYYLLHPPGALFGEPAQRRFGICHSGHGVNSYGLTIVRSEPPLACAVQTGWGGVYMDPDQQRQEHNRRTRVLDKLFETAKGSKGLERLRADDCILFVVESGFRGAGWGAATATPKFVFHRGDVPSGGLSVFEDAAAWLESPRAVVPRLD
jgi:hypothetical protein